MNIFIGRSRKWIGLPESTKGQMLTVAMDGKKRPALYLFFAFLGLSLISFVIPVQTEIH